MTGLGAGLVRWSGVPSTFTRSMSRGVVGGTELLRFARSSGTTPAWQADQKPLFVHPNHQENRENRLPVALKSDRSCLGSRGSVW